MHTHTSLDLNPYLSDSETSPHQVINTKVKIAQSYLTLCDPVGCSPPGSSVHGILQARIQEWVAISYSRGSSQPRDRTHVFCIAGRFFLPLHHLGRECEVSVEVCEVILFKSNWVLQQIVFSQSGPTNITPSHMPLF